MPVYEYACKSCRKDFMIARSLSETVGQKPITCPNCSSENAERKFTEFSAVTSKKS